MKLIGFFVQKVYIMDFLPINTLSLCIPNFLVVFKNKLSNFVRKFITMDLSILIANIEIRLALVGVLCVNSLWISPRLFSFLSEPLNNTYKYSNVTEPAVNVFHQSWCWFWLQITSKGFGYPHASDDNYYILYPEQIGSQSLHGI